KSKSRMGLPVSGDSLAFLSASWNFFSRRSEACFCASTDWRKIDSLRLSCSFMARAAASMSSKVLGTALGVCEMTAFTPGSILRLAPQHGQATSKDAAFLGILQCYRSGEGLATQESGTDWHRDDCGHVAHRG